MAENNLLVNEKEAKVILEVFSNLPMLTREQQALRDRIRRYLGKK